MNDRRGLPVTAIVALATVVAGGIGIWRGLSQEPAPAVDAPKSPLEAPRDAPRALEPAADPSYGPLGGVVRLSDGSPAAGAKVKARVASFVGKPTLKAPAVPADREVEADASGKFSLEVSLSWSWTLSAQKDGQVGVAVDVVPPDASVVLKLTGAQAVRVTVQEKNGQGVLNIPVGMTAEGKAAPAYEATTDAAGRVTFEKVPLGKWRVDAVENVVSNGPDGKPTARERRRAQAMVELQATAMGEVVLQFNPVGKIRGRVSAPQGEDLTRLVVFGVPASMGRAMLSQGFAAMQELLPRAYPAARVAADGRFELADVSGPQALVVPHPRLIHALVNAEPEGAEVEVKLFKDKVVRGKVTDAAGKPVTSFSVNGAPFESAEGSFEYSPPATPGAERPKNLPLIVTADGFQPLEKQLSFGAGDLEVGTLKLEAGRTFTLTVVEEQGGAPVEELTFARLEGTALSSEPAERLSPGVYRFSRLPNAPVVLSLTRFGGASRKVPVAPGDVQKTFRFGAGATVHGAVKAATGKPAVGARVALSGDPRSTRLTNGEGRYRMEGLEPGTVTLVVNFGRVNAVKKISVPETGELVVDIEMPPQP